MEVDKALVKAIVAGFWGMIGCLTGAALLLFFTRKSETFAWIHRDPIFWTIIALTWGFWNTFIEQYFDL